MMRKIILALALLIGAGSLAHADIGPRGRGQKSLYQQMKERQKEARKEKNRKRVESYRKNKKR